MKYFTQHLIVRYVISGGTSAAVNLATLYVLYYVLHVFYITSSIVAFLVSFGVSLILQKFWTFRDHSMDKLHHQIGKYLVTSLGGLCINTFVLYICVSHLHIMVFISQIIAGILTACCTFFISREYVFKGGEYHTTKSGEEKLTKV